MTAEQPEGLAGVGRIEAFSDGVFAIAITLLILEIRVPTALGPGGLWPALAAQWSSYAAYVLSFLVIGIMWANHHNIFRYIGRANHLLVMLNLALMFWVAVLPFPTAVLATYLRQPEHRTAATVLYGATLTFTALCYNLLWRHAAPAAAPRRGPGPRGWRHPGVPVRAGLLRRRHSRRVRQRVGEPRHS